MKSMPCVQTVDLPVLMEEITNELHTITESSRKKKEKDIGNIFLGTLFKLNLTIFGWLPPEEQSEILTACGTWFDIGLILGSSPKRLTEILKRINASLDTVEIPDWLTQRLMSE
jgi:hypothetical protein